MSEVESLTEQVLKLLDRMSPSERTEFLLCIEAVFCRSCGREQDPETFCQCENDE